VQVFERLESEVRSYCRTWPAVFDTAIGARLTDENGRTWIDFFAGAGALNYGHNPPAMAKRLVEYVTRGGVTHSLDMATKAKGAFLERFERVILKPRKLPYKVQFTGPTGTNAVEAALKLARKVTGRTHVVYFQNAFHGVTLGSLSVNGDPNTRATARVPLAHAIQAPFVGDVPGGGDAVAHLDALLARLPAAEQPAAAIVETVQAEGGIRAAPFEWLARLAALCRRRGMLLIVDDIQTGCGRTGTFFSFEPAGIVPDLVCLSKSLSGFGLALSVLLVKPEHDQWKPGEHNGTFRGNNLAFVTGHEALSHWEDDRLARDVAAKTATVKTALEKIAARLPAKQAEVRGRGLLQGLAFAQAPLAKQISRRAFEHGLLVEVCGPNDEVVKLLPPLTIATEDLAAGLGILDRAVAEVVSAQGPTAPAPTPPRPAPTPAR
jgi:diaminobutyrate-2-oxoglutarate transaminase